MKTACLNLDSPAFFTKWLTDLCQDSQREDGGLGDVAPHVSIVGFGNTGWADAGVVCNWQMYQLYGDTRVVQRHYPALVRYMDYLARTSKDYVRGTGAYGDWLRLAGPQHSEAIGTAYYFYSTRLMAELADAIGKSDDARKYRQQAEQIKAAFVKHFLKDDGRIVDAKGETGQTFYALAFGLDLVPEERQAQVARHFVEEIEKQDGHLATGFLGTPFVLFALEKAGQHGPGVPPAAEPDLSLLAAAGEAGLDDHVGALGRLAAGQGVPGSRHELVQPLLAGLCGRVAAVLGRGHRHRRSRFRAGSRSGRRWLRRGRA